MKLHLSSVSDELHSADSLLQTASQNHNLKIRCIKSYFYDARSLRFRNVEEIKLS